VVLGSVVRTPKVWSYFLHTSVVVAGFVAMKGLSQLSAVGGVRVDSTLGNAAYMAVYMLFHIFILAYLFIQTKVTPYRIIYGLLAVLFVYVLIQTGTRGTVIGLLVGTLTSVSYIALFATRLKVVRTYALASLVLLVVGVGAFVAVRDTDTIQNTPALARIANIDLGTDLRIRSIIWGMSVEGIKERPLLGWGQGNFNYVFNAQYDPRLYSQEQWFDRVHNIFFDWLIAGGIIGLISYFSIFAAVVYYLLIRPLSQPDDSFTVLERGILLGLVVGYVTHNLVVFDNIVSYIFFGTILALIHSKVAVVMPSLMRFRVPLPIVTQVALPVVIGVYAVCVYFINVPSMQAAGDIITAFQAKDLPGRLAGFELALGRNSFAHQEIVEQFAQQAMGVARSTEVIPEEIKNTFMNRTEEELLLMVKNKPGDARLHVFLASYYRTVGALPQAQEQMAIARTLSPNKQAIILQQGAVELSLGNNEAARDFFAEAFLLDETNSEAREYYVAALFYTKEIDSAKALIEAAPTGFLARLAASDFVVAAVNSATEYAFLAELYEERVKTNTENVQLTSQNWASLAFTYYQLKQNDVAIATLERAALAVPSFAGPALCFSKNIKAGKTPQDGCQ
jgi:O-antigen ligase/tetratricopeptide (TPR) repeat protein